MQGAILFLCPLSSRGRRKSPFPFLTFFRVSQVWRGVEGRGPWPGRGAPPRRRAYGYGFFFISFLSFLRVAQVAPSSAVDLGCLGIQKCEGLEGQPRSPSQCVVMESEDMMRLSWDASPPGRASEKRVTWPASAMGLAPWHLK